MDALTRNRTLKLGWGFKVAENILNIMARMEKHKDEKAGRILLKTFIRGFIIILQRRKVPSCCILKNDGER